MPAGCVRNKECSNFEYTANKYANDLQIVIVFFWDKKKNLKKTTNQVQF
jgi:hypothetical protein